MSSNEWAFMSGCCVCERVLTVIGGSDVYMYYFMYWLTRDVQKGLIGSQDKKQDTSLYHMY